MLAHLVKWFRCYSNPDYNEFDVETAKLLWELCIATDEQVMQDLLDKAKALGISCEALIQLLKSDEGERFTKSLIKVNKEFERAAAVATGGHLRPVS